jgi:hypothetical protein
MTERLRMLSTRRGSPDGIRIDVYESGRVYDLAPDLAAAFLREGWAEPADGRKNAGAAPENKALRAPPNKAVHKGFGRWYVVDPAGHLVSGPHRKAELEAMGLAAGG